MYHILLCTKPAIGDLNLNQPRLEPCMGSLNVSKLIGQLWYTWPARFYMQFSLAAVTLGSHLCGPRFAWAQEPIHLNGLLCPSGKKSLHYFENRSPLCICDFQCRHRAIRINGTCPRVPAFL